MKEVGEAPTSSIKRNIAPAPENTPRQVGTTDP